MPRVHSRLYRIPGSQFWHAAWTDHHGAGHRQSTGCRDHGAAKAWLATRELDRVKASAGIAVASQVALIKASAEYLDQRKSSWSDGWYQSVDAFFAHRIIPHFGEGRIVASITRADVEAFRAKQIDTKIRGDRKVSHATINRMMAALAAFGGWCLVDGRNYHTGNPWEKHPALPEDEKPIPAVSQAAVDAIFAALEDPTGPLPSHGRRRNRFPWRPLFAFVRETGLRKSELERMERGDIERSTRTLWMVSTRRRGFTKARKLRAIPLSKAALEILDGLPVRLDGKVWGHIPDPRRAFQRAARAAGMERVWLHLFRHLFASRLAERGAGRQELRDAGGWSSSRMADRYTHARMERLRALVEESDEASISQGTQKERAGRLP